MMETKAIAFTGVFTALTIALNLSPLKLPAPYAPFLYYQIWEIPIVTAFLLFGPPTGVGIAIINTIALLAIFPGELPTGPIYNLVAIMSTFVGVSGALLLSGRLLRGRKNVVLLVLTTILGTIVRVCIMSLVNWVFLRYPPPFGFSISEQLLIMWIPLIGFFNASLTLYTIPAGYYLATEISSRIKIGMWNPMGEKE